jgi:hypothetical protein
MALATLHDGSVLKIIRAKQLINIPIWKGNRIIDIKHVEELGLAIGENVKRLDFNYRIVTLNVLDASGSMVDESYVIDGQHRHRILQNYYQRTMCADDFDIVVLEKRVTSECEIIQYFNECNNVKSITWSDPNLVVNKYIGALEKVFNTKKTTLIRSGSTVRPYMMVESLRSALMKIAGKLKLGDTDVAAYVDSVISYNKKLVADAEVTSLGFKKRADAEMYMRAAKLGFLLAYDTRLSWVASTT